MQATVEYTKQAAQTPPEGKLTYEEFLDWCDEDTLAEWVEGEVIMTSPASEEHQDIGSLLEMALRAFVEAYKLGKVMRAPFQMKLDSSGREPDLLFVSAGRLNRVRETYLDGPADLAIEIVSPESGARDRGEKFYEHEAGGVREFWLIDPARRLAEFYQLGEDKLFHNVAPDVDGIYHSHAVPGFWLRLDWLWKRPPVLDVLRELRLL